MKKLPFNMLQKNYFFVVLSLFLSGCSISHEVAPIEYHHSQFLNENPEQNNGEIDKTDPKAYQEDEIIETPMQNNSSNTESAKASNPNTVKYAEVNLDEELLSITAVNNTEKPEVNNTKKPEQLPSISSKQPVITYKAPVVKNDKTTFIKPVSGEIIIKFNEQTSNGVSKGINIKASEGHAISAAASGTIIYADYDAVFGNLVIIKIQILIFVTAYAHMEDIIVEKGHEVSQGDIIGYVGKSGKVSSSQLHFSIRDGKKTVDPEKYIGF